MTSIFGPEASGCNTCLTVRLHHKKANPRNFGPAQHKGRTQPHQNPQIRLKEATLREMEHVMPHEH